MVYRDILNQITKYLKPKEEYYLHLEIDYHNRTIYTFYLIYGLDGNTKMKYEIETISYDYVYFENHNLKHEVNETIVNDYLLISLTHRENKMHRKFLLVDKKNMELGIFTTYPISIYEFKSYIEDSIDLNFYLNSNLTKSFKHSIYHDTTHTFKINKKNLEEIKEGIEIFKKIQNLNIKDLNLTEKEKKYVSIK